MDSSIFYPKKGIQVQLRTVKANKQKDQKGPYKRIEQTLHNI